MAPLPLRPTLFPYTTLFRSGRQHSCAGPRDCPVRAVSSCRTGRDRKSTPELQSRPHLVCRLLLEKKKKTANTRISVLHEPNPAREVTQLISLLTDINHRQTR